MFHCFHFQQDDMATDNLSFSLYLTLKQSLSLTLFSLSHTTNTHTHTLSLTCYILDWYFDSRYSILVSFHQKYEILFPWKSNHQILFLPLLKTLDNLVTRQPDLFENTVTIWIPDKSGIWMVQVCPVVEWSGFWMVVWKPGKSACFMV